MLEEKPNDSRGVACLFNIISDNLVKKTKPDLTELKKMYLHEIIV